MKHILCELIKLLMDQVILILHMETMCCFHSKFQAFLVYPLGGSGLCSSGFWEKWENTARLTAISASRFVSSYSPEFNGRQLSAFSEAGGLGRASKHEKKDRPHGLISIFLSDVTYTVIILVSALFRSHWKPLHMAVSFCIIFRIALGS